MSCQKFSKSDAPSPSSSSSDASSTPPNPMNVFYVWYPELCRRAGTQPLSHVKPAKPKHETVLDFVCDRLRPEEWTLVMGALRLDASLHAIAIRSRTACTFLHDVDSAEKAARMKRRAGSVFTAFVARALHKSLGACIRRNRVLSSLVLDGIPVGPVDVELLVNALQNSWQSLRTLSLRGTQLGDVGCEILCSALRQLPSIVMVDLSGCDLGARSAKAIAGVVRVQQISRYCESWHKSLRYEDPDVVVMAGLKRITLNGNPGIGDDGLAHILDELDDDLWIRALDMQRCGLTDAVSARLLDVVEHSRSLAIADFRHNALQPEVIDTIFELLKDKQMTTGGASEARLKWCLSASTMRAGSSLGVASRSSVFYAPGKSKSVPNRQQTSAPTAPPLRRAKTALTMTPKTEDVAPKLLGSQLQREVCKRMRSEKENRKLKQELAKLKAEVGGDARPPPPPPPKPKTIKYDPLTKKTKLKIDLQMRPPQAEQQLKIPDNGTKKVAFNIFQKLVNDGEKEDEQEDNKQPSVINVMRDFKANQQKCNDGRQRLWKRANTAFLQIVH